MTLYFSVASFTVSYFSLLFILACSIGNYAIADIGWGVGFILITLLCGYMSGTVTTLFWLVLGLVFCWGTRLSLHIYWRNKGKPEDFRYLQLRKKWIQYPYLQAYVKLYLTQALATLLVSTAILTTVLSNEQNINIYSVLFFVVALIGFLYESVSDYQLAAFKKNPANNNKIMQQGLWRFSRHPNYFGEIIFWWGLSLMIAITTGNFLALISGLTMNLLIVFVSGVPMLEAKYKNNPHYADYIQTTNSLLPIKFH